MQLNTTPGGPRNFQLNLAGSGNHVVRNKNTGQSFWVRGKGHDHVDLMPMQGYDIKVLDKDFTTDSWEVVH